jgi:hypothetical protein
VLGPHLSRTQDQPPAILRLPRGSANSGEVKRHTEQASLAYLRLPLPVIRESELVLCPSLHSEQHLR